MERQRRHDRWSPILVVIASLAVHAGAWQAMAGRPPRPAPPPPPVRLVAIPVPVEEPAVEEPVEEPPQPEPEPEPEPVTPPPTRRARRAPPPAPIPETMPPPTEQPPVTEPAEAAPVDLDTVLAGNDGGWTLQGGRGTGATPGGRGTGAAPRPTRGTEGGTPGGTGTTRDAPLASLDAPPSQPPALDRLLQEHYPPDARRAGQAGSARIRVRITAQGVVQVRRVLSASSPAFGRACAQAMRASPRWRPGQDRQGQPAATQITFNCRFAVND